MLIWGPFWVSVWGLGVEGCRQQLKPTKIAPLCSARPLLVKVFGHSGLPAAAQGSKSVLCDRSLLCGFEVGGTVNIIYHILNSRIRPPHGSIYTEVATSYCTTNKANIIYHILNSRIRRCAAVPAQRFESAAHPCLQGCSEAYEDESLQT